MPRLNQRGAIAQVLVLLLLAAGLIGGLYLVQHPQIFKPKAAPQLPQNPETSFELELENTAIAPFPDETTPPNLTIGAKFRVDIYARADTDAANLFSAKLKYSRDTVEFVEINKRDGQSFVKNWVENSENNGLVSLVGGMPSPGVKTDPKVGAYLLGSVIFKAKKTGTAIIELSDSSAIYSNTNNINILTARKGAISVAIQDTPPPTPSPTPSTFSCTSLSVEGGIQVKNNSGVTVYYVVDSGGVVKITVYPSPSTTKLEWKEVARSQNLPEGKFTIPVDRANTTVYYTVPENSGNQLEGVDVRADAPWDGKNPQLSCPTVTFAVQSALVIDPIDPIVIGGESITYTINENGWTMIGIPLTITMASADFLNLTNGKCTAIQGFDASAGQARAYFSDPAKKVLNSLTQVTGGNGYLIDCSAPVTFGLSGTAITSLPGLVDSGVQYISVPKGYNKTAEQFLTEASTNSSLNCTEVNRYIHGGWEGHIRGLAPNNFQMDDLAGYSVKCVAGGPVPPTVGTGDGNGNGQIDLGDMSVLLTAYNKPESYKVAVDLNGDGVVNTFDFFLMKTLLIQEEPVFIED